ncbi:MAG TPA: DUF2277 domain-containing protein [Spirochaetia bacterium]|nr:DUF2277 domain-containing protein [Spirochaetia bacterium]
MCRNIRPLFNFDPPANEEEVRAAALQFVRKVSGFTHPSVVNQGAFDQAVDAIARDCAALLASLVTTSPPRDRVLEAAKARQRLALRFPVRRPGDAV